MTDNLNLGGLPCMLAVVFLTTGKRTSLLFSYELTQFCEIHTQHMTSLNHIICKTLYGLCSSDAQFHKKLADTMHHLGFKSSYADPNVWYCNAGDCYEYVCIYVDDLLIALEEPNTFIQQLQSNHWNYKPKDLNQNIKFLNPSGALYASMVEPHVYVLNWFIAATPLLLRFPIQKVFEFFPWLHCNISDTDIHLFHFNNESA